MLPRLYALLVALPIVGASISAQTPTSVGASQHSGAVDLFISGNRPEPKTPDQILSTAKATKFYPSGSIKREFGQGGTIEYTPREFQANAVATALSEGLLVSQLTVGGTPQPQSRLQPGVYYVFVDFVEGRWTGRVIDARSGRIACVMLGLEAKEVITFGGPELHKAHNRPIASIHAVRLPGSSPTAAQDWVEYQVEWTQLGAGCVSKIICIPAT